MSKVKKQHFVPRFYLNNFTDSESNIYAFDMIRVESFRSTVDNIAHQKYFYDYEPLDQFIGRHGFFGATKPATISGNISSSCKSYETSRLGARGTVAGEFCI